MSDTVKLIIEIPKEALNLIKTFKGKFICNGYDLIQGVQNGIPLDDVKAEIRHLEYHMIDCDVLVDRDMVMWILDNIGKENGK